MVRQLRSLEKAEKCEQDETKRPREQGSRERDAARYKEKLLFWGD